ncbi:MAG: hypothetical protein ACYCSS_04155 [Sulfuriferula sp.]
MHFLNHKLLTIITRLMLATILFMQYSLATQACMLMEAHPAMAFATQAMPGCVMNNMVKPNPNACFVHCTSSDQTLDTYHAALNPVAILPVVTLIIAPLSEWVVARIYPPLQLAYTGGPPLYLLLQNFRN